MTRITKMLSRQVVQTAAVGRITGALGLGDPDLDVGLGGLDLDPDLGDLGLDPDLGALDLGGQDHLEDPGLGVPAGGKFK